MRSAFLWLLVAVLSSVSCANIKKPENEKCALAGDASTFTASSYTLYLYGPNDELNPDIWEGPVCIERQTNFEVCELDISLIKGVEIDAAGGLQLKTFSGSVEQVFNVNVKQCSVN